MESSEVTVNLEKENQPKYDTIVVFGRGIAKDIKSKWRPTRYVEELKEGQHSGIFPKTIKPQAENAYIGGANANVLAAVQLFAELVERENPPRLVIFAAGRPAYLEREPSWLSEGKVLEEKFLRKTKS